MSDVRAVYKYPLPTPGTPVTHEMPAGAVFAHVDTQMHEASLFQMWWVVDSDADLVQRTFVLLPTGRHFEGAWLGTVTHPATATVWHLIERLDT